MSNEKDINNETTVNSEYGVDQVDSLEGLEAVRKRPGMYIGSTSQRGVTQLIWEILDNSVDENVAGHGSEISISVMKGGKVRIEDHGRGMPVGEHHKWKNEDGTPMNALTGLLTKLHAGGKFGNGGYKCFKEGSMVNTTNGFLPIEKINTNVRIINSYNEPDDVLNKFEYNHNGNINKIVLENGKCIEAINGHYILIQRNEKLYWEIIENIINTDMLVELEPGDDIEKLKKTIPTYNIRKY